MGPAGHRLRHRITKLNHGVERHNHWLGSPGLLGSGGQSEQQRPRPQLLRGGNENSGVGGPIEKAQPLFSKSIVKDDGASRDQRLEPDINQPGDGSGADTAQQRGMESGRRAEGRQYARHGSIERDWTGRKERPSDIDTERKTPCRRRGGNLSQPRLRELARKRAPLKALRVESQARQPRSFQKPGRIDRASAGGGCHHNPDKACVIDGRANSGRGGVPGNGYRRDRVAARVGLKHERAPRRRRREQYRPGRDISDQRGAAGEPCCVRHGQRSDRQCDRHNLLASVDRLDRQRRAVWGFERLHTGEDDPGSGCIGSGPQPVEECRKFPIGRRIHLPVGVVGGAIAESSDWLPQHRGICHGSTVGDAGIERKDKRRRAVEGEDRHLAPLGFPAGLGGRNGKGERRAGFLGQRIGSACLRG